MGMGILSWREGREVKGVKRYAPMLQSGGMG
jgi:hypothetical protein